MAAASNIDTPSWHEGSYGYLPGSSCAWRSLQVKFTPNIPARRKGGEGGDMAGPSSSTAVVAAAADADFKDLINAAQARSDILHVFRTQSLPNSETHC